jgi:hypothetical protein
MRYKEVRDRGNICNIVKRHEVINNNKDCGVKGIVNI